MTEQRCQKAGENGKWEASGRLNKGERRCRSGRRKKRERQKCGSCDNVKEKCIMIKTRGRMEFAPAGTAVNKDSDCQ